MGDLGETTGMSTALEQMELGIFARTFARPTLDGVLEVVRDLGLRWVQFNFACAGLPAMPDAMGPALLARIGAAHARCGVRVAAVSGTCNLVHPDVRERALGLRRLRVVAAACSGLGTRLITLCTGSRDPHDMWRAHPDNDGPEAWRDLRASLEQVAAVAEEFDLRLGIEPETGNVIHSAAKARRLLDEMRTPRLGVIMDAANLYREADLPRGGEMIREAFDLLGGDLVLAHAKELGANARAGHLALGEGVLDWDCYLACLRRAGYAGPLIMHGFEEAAARASAGFLRDKLGRMP